jgi:hypothetical protein
LRNVRISEHVNVRRAGNGSVRPLLLELRAKRLFKKIGGHSAAFLL